MGFAIFVLLVVFFLNPEVASAQTTSLYAETMDVCPLSPGRIAGVTAELKHVSSQFKYPYYEQSAGVRSDIECTLVCRRSERCVAAFFEESTATCYLTDRSLHDMANPSYGMLTSGKGDGSRKDDKTFLMVRSDQTNVNYVDSSAECSSTSCSFGSYSCRKDCTNNVGFCTAQLTECNEVPVSNIRHYYILNYSDGSNDATLTSFTKTYKKQYSYTALRVVFRGPVRAAYDCGSCCSRWYFTFNDAECTNPGFIEAIWYQGMERDDYRPLHLEGICQDDFPAGDVTIKINVGVCSGYGAGDANTGFGSSTGVSITVEENDMRHGFETNLATYGGNGGGTSCVFPFVYDGQSHSQCTEINHNQLWCATTSNYDVDGKWGNCPGTCPHHSRFNIKQYSWTGVNGADSGHLYTYYYYKRADDTSLRVLFYSNVHLYPVGWLYYTIKFDGTDCTNPGIINGVWGHGDSTMYDSRYDGTGLIEGICSSVSSGRISVEVHLHQVSVGGSNADGYTGWISRSRIIVEEVRLGTDVSAVIASDASVQRLPEFNLAQWHWNNRDDETENGVVLTVTYTKLSSQSHLWMQYNGALRQYETVHGAPGCARWYFTINDQDCQDPGTIASVVRQENMYNTVVMHDNIQVTSSVGGYCKLSAGTYTIKLRVATCLSHNNAQTCYGARCTIMMKEVFLVDW